MPRNVHVVSPPRRIFGPRVGLSAVLPVSLLHGCYTLLYPLCRGGAAKGARFGALNGALGASSGVTGFAKPRCDFRPLALDPSYMSERLGDLTSRERELVDAVA